MEEERVDESSPFISLAEAKAEESFYKIIDDTYCALHKIPMSLEEIIEKYGELLTKQEIEKLKNHGR